MYADILYKGIIIKHEEYKGNAYYRTCGLGFYDYFSKVVNGKTLQAINRLHKYIDNRMAT